MRWLRNYFIPILILFFHTYTSAQSEFKGIFLQGKDTLEISQGLKRYDAVRFSWINTASEKLKAIEVHFGNGQFPFTTRHFKVAKGQKLVVIDLQEFLAIETRDLASPRKRESEVSRIVIICVMENSTRYKRYTIPFKLQE